MIEKTPKRERMARDCRVFKQLLSESRLPGVLSVLQDIGRIEIDANEIPDGRFGELAERYRVVFGRLRDEFKVITPEIHERYFADT